MLKTIQLPVHSIAHGRAGDKGDVSNVSLIAYNKFGWKNIQTNATEDTVLSIFKHFGATSVKRYELPNLMALNFVIQNLLEVVLIVLFVLIDTGKLYLRIYFII